MSKRIAELLAQGPRREGADMRILYLGPPSPLHEWLRRQHDVIFHMHPVDAQYMNNETANNWFGAFDWIVSYNYAHILKPDVLAAVEGRAVNLHISLLPWNRGCHPNVWSWAEDTPKGVTLHYMDEGVDTGDIIAQSEVTWDSLDGETLRTTYAKLDQEAQLMFRRTWPDVVSGSVGRMPQARCDHGSYHARADLAKLQHLLTDGWDTPISVLDSYAANGQLTVAARDRQTEEMAE